MPGRAPVFRPATALARPEQRRLYEERRGSSVQRGYDRHWQRCRDAYLSRHPLCARCWRKGRIEAATEVHHKVAVRAAPERRLEWNNLLALCHPCHMSIEARGGGDPIE